MTPPTTDHETRLRNLLALPDDQFTDLVTKNLARDTQPELWELLCHPDLAPRTHTVLATTRRRVRTQLTRRTQDLAAYRGQCRAAGPDGMQAYRTAKAEHQKWKRRTNGYLRLLDARLAEIEPLLDLPEPTPREPRGGNFPDGPPKRGISDIVALALVALELDTIHRDTVRALCPIDLGSRTRARGSITGTKIADAYRRFERHGWIRRDGALIHVLDRNGLCTWISKGTDTGIRQSVTLLNILDAIHGIEATDLDEQRRRELHALQRLMESASTRYRGVRLTHRTPVL